MSNTILVVDDEARLLALVKAYLEQGGYKVVTAQNGREAIFVSRQEKPDLILLDIMMPEMDGYEFMRIHQQEHPTPIILLTAKVEDDEKVIGLELGADDYVTKPFSPRELLARVKAVLRRGNKPAARSTLLRVADVSLDFDRYVVEVAGVRVDLTRSEFDLLAILMAAPGRAFSRLDLLDKLQGTIFVGSERTVDVHIKNLRSKIEPNPRKPRYIETVYGVGYRFAVE
ncbi:MAG: response regulator transcription factor [Chloroflexi bacterium]|nr:response regulator transcription factor [Chloroflexota bacterium]